jgi:hypothetical protein
MLKPLWANHYMMGLGGKQRFNSSEGIQTLKRFDVVGITENMDSFMVRLALHLGCDPVDFAYRSEKVVVGRPTFKDIPGDLQKYMESRLEYDLDIYRSAKIFALEDEARVGGVANAISSLRAEQAARGEIGCHEKMSEADKTRLKAEGKEISNQPMQTDCTYLKIEQGDGMGE